MNRIMASGTTCDDEVLLVSDDSQSDEYSDEDAAAGGATGIVRPHETTNTPHYLQTSSQPPLPPYDMPPPSYIDVAGLSGMFDQGPPTWIDPPLAQRHSDVMLSVLQRHPVIRAPAGGALSSPQITEEPRHKCRQFIPIVIAVVTIATIFFSAGVLVGRFVENHSPYPTDD